MSEKREAYLYRENVSGLGGRIKPVESSLIGVLSHAQKQLRDARGRMDEQAQSIVGLLYEKGEMADTIADLRAKLDVFRSLQKR